LGDDHSGAQILQPWDELWKLAQVAPPAWSAFLINTLFENHWAPAGESDSPDWANLATGSCRLPTGSTQGSIV